MAVPAMRMGGTPMLRNAANRKLRRRPVYVKGVCITMDFLFHHGDTGERMPHIHDRSFLTA